MRVPRPLLIAGGTVLLLAGAAAAVTARIRAGSAETAEGGAPQRKGAGVETSASGSFSTDVAIPVEGRAAVRQTLVTSVSAAGQAEAWQKTVLVAQVNGRIVSLPVREGSAVRAGQPLVGLDGAEYQLAVEEAEASHREAQNKYREFTLGDDVIADAGVRRDREAAARARSGLDAADVRVRRARLDLQRTRLAAPFGGRIATLKVVPGQWVRTGDELMTIVALDPIRVEVQVLESEITHLAPGRIASVSFAAFPGETFSGRIQTLNPVVESGTRTARVTVLVRNPGGRILPGMYARVSLEARQYADRVLVPRSALLERDRRPMLFVYEGGEDGGLAKWRYVTTGLQNDSLIEIVPAAETDSVRAGEVVLTDGHYTLIHDARVRLVDDVRRSGGRPD
ncbi:MAG TPA: efflux RND transporter periplasmic adaptor subunit [Longimicrobium sp.]|nr:efflux RND transporter periplasmic adaptor subunit [Longimicrobium sp.]